MHKKNINDERINQMKDILLTLCFIKIINYE